MHQEVPPELVAACDRHGLPLLRLPPATPFVAVGQAAYAAIAEARNRELREISRAQSALATAATRPDALQAVLDRLSAHTGAWTVLYDAQGNELFSAGPRPSSPTPGRVRDLAVRTTARLRTGAAGRSAPAAAADHHGETHLTVHTLPGADGSMALALGQAATTAPTLVHRQVTSTATVLLALLTSPRHALGTDTHSAGALVRLMLGATAAVVHTKDPLTVYGIVPRTDARDLARTRFAPLDQAGAPGAPVLLDTLRTWLTLHGSWDRTAAALHVHRNTVRHRLARVGELLDVDLHDPGVRMELWFALHWLPGETDEADE